MSSNVGGYIRGPWWRYATDNELNTRRCFVIAWGQIVQKPVDKVNINNTRSVQFVIKTGRGAGRNEKHLACICYGDTLTAVVMRAMEKGDIVFVCGQWYELSYKNKKGESKMRYEARINFIIPLGLIHYLLELYVTDSIQDLVEAYRNADADVWESDYWQEGDEE
jgi:hypothetical protein